MKTVFILLFSLLITSPIIAQNTIGDSEISVSTGASRYNINSYNFKNGYRVGVDLNQGISKRIFTTIGISFGEDDGTYTKPSYWLETSTVRDIQLGIGIGVNALQSIKHRLYLKAVVGGVALMGSSSTIKNDGTREIQYDREYNNLGLSTRLSTGYIYYPLKRIGIGVGYDFIYLHNIGHIHNINASLSFKL